MNDELPDDILICDEGPAGILIVADEDVFRDRVLPVLFRFRMSGRFAVEDAASHDRCRLRVSGTI